MSQTKTKAENNLQYTMTVSVNVLLEVRK